jgi:hypothetical protein
LFAGSGRIFTYSQNILLVPPCTRCYAQFGETEAARNGFIRIPWIPFLSGKCAGRRKMANNPGAGPSHPANRARLSDPLRGRRKRNGKKRDHKVFRFTT